MKKVLATSALTLSMLLSLGTTTFAAAPSYDIENELLLNYNSEMILSENECIVSQNVEWLSEDEFIIETVSSSYETASFSLNARSSGTRKNTVKKEHGHRVTGGFVVTGTATLTCEFKYNSDKNTVSCTSKTYSFKPGSGVKMEKNGNITVTNNSGFLFVKPSVTVTLPYTFTAASGASTDYTLSMTCDTEGNI